MESMQNTPANNLRKLRFSIVFGRRFSGAAAAIIIIIIHYLVKKVVFTTGSERH